MRATDLAIAAAVLLGAVLLPIDTMTQVSAVGRQRMQRTPDIHYVPTPANVVDAMMTIAGVGAKDVVYDLGSGDGRIVIAAAKRGARGVGIELDPGLVAEASR